MAVNLARFKEQEITGFEDYRHYKQPFELKNVNELQIMTENEKEMYIMGTIDKVARGDKRCKDSKRKRIR